MFHSQYQIKLGYYRDDNNFIQVNEVQTSDARYNIFANEHDYHFYDIEQRPTWIGKKRIAYRNVSDDDGKTWKMREEEVLSGTFFFLSENEFTHSRSVVTITEVFAELGGFADFVIIILGMILIPFNELQLQTKAIRNIYFRVKNFEDEDKDKKENDEDND